MKEKKSNKMKGKTMKENTEKKRNRARFFATMACITFATISCVGVINAKNNEKDVISQGIYIGNINVGGMTEKKATKALKKYVSEVKSETVVVNIDEQEVTTTLEDLGYSCDISSFVHEAFQYGKTGDVIQRYKQKKDLEQENVVFDLAFELDDQKVQDFVKEECTVYDVPAENAKLKRKNGKFKTIEAKTGRVIVVDETVKKIETTIGSQWVSGGITIDAIMNDATPQYDGSTLSECKDLLGKCSTSFASSDSSRSQNLDNAAKLLNGYTIYPGETFSVAEHLVPFTEENGYKTSKAYSNGQVVDSVGGGVCQAATTLYNALLRAELEIVERYNHSMIVSYVKPSMDAAISEGYKDLKFKNNTDTPIYLQGYTLNRSIYFNIYGKETRDLEKRTVEYESEVLEEIAPGPDKVVIDESLPEGYESVTQSAHVGYKAKLWKIVYENGEQVSKEQVNYSYYAPEPRYVTKGGKEKEKNTPKPTEENKDKDKTETTATKKPEPTKKPAMAEEKPEETQKETQEEKPEENQEKEVSAETPPVAEE